MASVRILFLQFLLLVSVNCLAQKKFTNPSLANSLKSDYQDESVVATNALSAFEFTLDDQKLSISQSDKISIITLENSVKYQRNLFYNEKITVEDTHFKYTSARGSVNESHSCGNYEVDNVFYSDAKVCSYSMDFLYEATEVTMTFETKIHDPRYLTKVFFHDQDPTLSRVITFEIPNEIDIELIEKNFDGYSIQKKKEKSETGTRYTYSVDKLPAFRNEENSLGILYEYPHIIVVTKSLQTPSGVKPVLASVDDLYRWYAELVEAVDKDRSVFKEKVKELTDELESDKDKIRAIYYWVQENIKYIAFEDGIAGFQPESATNVFRNRYGDCKGMAMLTREMLREAGVDCRLAWIGTNRIPYTYDLPSLAVDNHVICTVFTSEGEYIIDPTERFMGVGEHSERIQGKEMLIEDGETYIRKRVPTDKPENNQWDRTEKLTLRNGLLTGTGKLNIRGESKNDLIMFYNRCQPDERTLLLNHLAVRAYKNNDEVEINKVSEMDRERDLDVSYAYSLNNKVSSFDADIYVDLDWNDKFSDLTFDEDRSSDYYFGRKVMERTTKHFTIPSGFKLTHIPENLEVSHEDISIRVTYEKSGDKVIYFKEFVVASGIISKADFDVWNDIITKLEEVNNDQIVLTKIL